MTKHTPCLAPKIKSITKSGMLCSYNSGSFQLSCLRFLNTFLETAASLEERVYIQEELRLAGLDDFDLESLGQQVILLSLMGGISRDRRASGTRV